MTPLEAMARAICCPSGHCHIVQINERAETAIFYPQPWPCCWRQSLDRARAALEALRTPTATMLDAARDWSLAKYHQGVGNEEATGCWQAMISAALAEEPTQ